MNVIFFIPYYNNSHFIGVQVKSFKKYLKNCNWKICVIDDSTDTTINVLNKTKEDIYKVTSKYPDNIIYHKFPQNLHNSTNATDRHCNILNYVVRQLSLEYKSDYDYLCLFDADMCIVEDFDVLTELENYDIIGPKRIQWLSTIQLSDSPIFEYIFVHNCFFNLKTVTNLQTMNLSRIPHTTCDTGSMIMEFFYNNPNYKIKFIDFSAGAERISDLYNFEFVWNRKIIHFTTGTMWDGASYNTNKQPYSYKEKLDKMEEIVNRGLSESERQIIENTYLNIWNKFKEKYVGKLATKNDFIKYGLKIN